MSERPYTVCHILTSLDGKIDGSFMSAPETMPALRAYSDIRGQYDCPATVYGTITMIEGYAEGLAPVLPEQSHSLPRKDHVADAGAGHYIVSVDPKGTLGFRSNAIEKKSRPKAHIIQVLTEQVSDRYIAYLREKDISYIFAGADGLECTAMVKKLRTVRHPAADAGGRRRDGLVLCPGRAHRRAEHRPGPGGGWGQSGRVPVREGRVL